MKRSIMLLVCVLLAVALLATVGCQLLKEVNPGTGEKKETLGVNPKTADAIVGGLETVGKVVLVADSAMPPASPYKLITSLVLLGIATATTILKGVQNIQLVRENGRIRVEKGKMEQGSMAAGRALAMLKKDDSIAWSDVEPILLAAKDIGAIMPHKIPAVTAAA